MEIEKMNLLLGRAGTRQKWERLFLSLLRGRFSSKEVRSLLLLLAKKGEAADEITACLLAARKLEPPHSVSLPSLIDVCGTGGDRMRTFNISTVSSFVIAGAGGYVAKHGNRAVSSQVGSSDLVEALGIRLDIPFERMLEALRRYHLGYFHAPFYHRSFSGIQPIRRQLGIRTLFNLMGPLLNPLELGYQMIGVSDSEWFEPLARALGRLPRRKSAVVHSIEGLDELSTCSTNDILLIEDHRMRRLRLDPKKLGFSRVSREDYRGGDLKTNHAIALRILEGRLQGPQQDVVLLNSGFALWLMGLAKSVGEGVEKSRWTLRTGRALGILEALRRATN